MTQKTPLTVEQRDAALRDIRGEDKTRIVEAAKLLSSDASTTPFVLPMLDEERRPEVRQGLLYALAWHSDLETWELLIRILSDVNEAPGVRGQAAEGLAYMFDKVEPATPRFEAAIAALKRALEDASPEVRYCAVFAMGATRHPPLVPIIEKMLEDRTPVPGWMGTVADEAARALDFMRPSSM